MKWEKIGSGRKAELVQRICSYLKLPLMQMFDPNRLNPNENFTVGYMRFDNADYFLFGNLLSDHSPAPLSGQGMYSLEQLVGMGFSKMPRRSVALFDRLDFSSVSALEIQLSAFGY